MSRQQQRHDLASDMRVRLLEDDLDRAEENIITAKQDLDEKITHAKNTAKQLIEAAKYDLTSQITGVHADMVGLRAEMLTGFKECEDRDDQTRKLLTALLVSIVTLCVTVTVGVLVAVGGG